MIGIGLDVAEPLLGKQDRGADGRVPGKGQFARRGEDAQPGRMGRIVRRQHEDRLREVEFAGDGLHAGIRQPFRVQHDSQGIARKRLIGEHVEDKEASGHREVPCWAATAFRLAGLRVAPTEPTTGETVAWSGAACQPASGAGLVARLTLR